MSAVILVFNEKLMRLMFGRVEDGVMEACLVYLRISAYSYPALAVYNAGPSPDSLPMILPSVLGVSLMLR